MRDNKETVNCQFPTIYQYEQPEVQFWVLVKLPCPHITPNYKCKTFHVFSSPSKQTTVEHRPSELMWGRGVRIIKKYVKSNTYTFIYRALFKYSNKVYTS